MRRILLALALLLAPLATHAHGPVATGFSGGGGANQLRPPVPSFENQNVDSSGVPNDPRGMVYIDMMTGISSNPGGRRDVNGSMWGVDPGAGICNGSTSACADAVTDFIKDTGGSGGTVFTFAAANAQWQYNGAAIIPETADTLFCRDSTTPFPACSNTAVGTCTSVPNGNNPESIVAKVTATGRYYPLSMQAYAGCVAGGASNAQWYSGPAVALGASDTFQTFQGDGIHQSKYMSGLIAQTVAEARWEAFFYPKKNMLTNGDFELDCASSNGWHNSANYAVQTNMTQVSYDGTNNSPGAASSVYGKGCRLSNSRAAGTGITSDAVTVQPYTWYQAHGYVSSNEIGNGNGLTINVIDDSAAPGALISGLPGGAATDVLAWHLAGDYVAVAGNPPTTVSVSASGQFEAYNWGYYVVKFYTGAQRTVRLSFRTVGGQGVLKFDHWFMSPAVVQNSALNFIFPSGAQKWSLEGDSRAAVPGNTYLAEQLDTVFAASRPDISLQTTFLATTYAIPGRQATQATAASGVVGFKPNFGLFLLGINDVSSSAILSSNLRTAWKSIATSIKKAGAIPVMIGELPYKADTSTTCTDDSGSVVCGVKLNNAMQRLFTTIDMN